MKRKQKSTPFFSRYLETQESVAATGGVLPGGCTSPGDTVTLRYPSDDDEDRAPTI